MNYTASFLTFSHKQILDELGIDIPSIHYVGEQYPYKFEIPSLKFNVFEDDKKEPIIKRIWDMETINKMGFSVYSIPITKNEAWRKFQRTAIILLRDGLTPPEDSRKLKVLIRNSGNTDFIEFDEANLKIRLRGIKAGPNFAGPWIKVE